MLTWIDGTLYPDIDVPDELPTLGDRVDFLARLCSAWDFGLLPDRETSRRSAVPIGARRWTPPVFSPPPPIISSAPGTACPRSPIWASNSPTSGTIRTWSSCSRSLSLPSPWISRPFLGMDRQDDGEIRAPFVELEAGLRRAVGRHGLKDLRHSGAARLGELQLFEQLADTAIAGRHLRDAPARREVLELQSRHRA